MGLFDKFKNKKSDSNVAESVPEAEKQYYNDDDYYQKVAFSGTVFEKEVLTFKDWKKRSYPSKSGLYVPEILLLQYCEYGDYPHPNRRGIYPGLWWYQYGIRDVTAALKTLEDSGFICFGSVYDGLKNMKVPELKELLKDKGCSDKGKKADLIERISENYTEQELMEKGVEPKYILTPLGEKELRENEYIPFMHNFHGKTVANCENEFTVWSINRVLKGIQPENWKDIVVEEYNRTHAGSSHFDQIFRADAEYRIKGDFDKYVAFWESLWSDNETLEVDAPLWIFKLPELYAEQGRFDEALALINKYNHLYEYKYEDYAAQLIQRIKEKKKTQQ